MLSLILILSILFNISVSLPEALYDLMNDSEKAFYFQNSNQSPQYEVIYLPKEALEDRGNNDEINFNFEAFERPISLRLKRNSLLTSPNFKTFINRNDEETILFDSPPKDCHFLHLNQSTIAAISMCDNNSVQGLLILDEGTFEIQPLTPRLQSLFHVKEPLELTPTIRIPHLIKRAKLPTIYDNSIAGIVDRKIEAASHRPADSFTLELAMFFDEPGYKIFAPYMNYDDQKLQDMLLAYLNGVQALYHHPSLGASLQIVLVRLDIMKQQPSKMPHYEGERGKLLDSFCAYQQKLNEGDDNDPNHWDMAVYISGLDFFAYEKGRKSGVTMGLATVGGVCLDQYACVIAEFGTTNAFGKPYPSAGFTSVYILAHEIGHNLGMHHDSVGNSCPKEGFIMSPSRGTNGETQWSTCSADIMKKLDWATCLQDSAKSPKHLDHSRFYDNPGQQYTAKKQCEILLRDKDAVMSPNQDLSTICYNLQCKTPHRSGYYFAGPALDGTQCGNGKYCYGGDCVLKQPPKPPKVVIGGWGPWKDGKCESGCIEKSKGFQMKRRHCNNPAPVNTDQGCQGSSIEFGICRDEKICKNKRQSVVDYASNKCREFSKLLPELDSKGLGLQAPHEEARLWMGCAIFCKRADSGSFYTPRIELNDLGVTPYFPDGTWCHRQGDVNYYCLHHHCLPENFHFSKTTSILKGMGQDILLSQNARPYSILPPEIKSYLSLTPDGKPIKTVIKPYIITKLNEEEWETDDYIEIPELEERHEPRHTRFNTVY